MGVITWIVAHWPELVGVLGALLSVASFVVALTPSPKDDEVVRKIMAFLSFLQPKNAPGTVKAPLSRPAEVPLIAPRETLRRLK